VRQQNRWHPAFVDRDYVKLARRARQEQDRLDTAAERERLAEDCPFGDGSGCVMSCEECRKARAANPE
jgi:hypothetical protein